MYRLSRSLLTRCFSYPTPSYERCILPRSSARLFSTSSASAIAHLPLVTVAGSIHYHRPVTRLSLCHQLQSMQLDPHRRPDSTTATATALIGIKRPFTSTTTTTTATNTNTGTTVTDSPVTKRPHLAPSELTASTSSPATVSSSITNIIDIDMSNAPIAQSDPLIQLTVLERDIFQHVLDCCQHFKLATEVRVAGGWVRDKLLGLESDDIDLALDNMSGEEFALKLQEYMQSIGKKTSSFGVMKVNPEQSKHLATATMKILDVSIDINNFREEVYHANSRIPEITLATAKEDALRRDFTSNALFYNIKTKKIEDYVNGLTDLRARHLRTPYDPSKTFSDDPLRILRAARFAGRFGYSVDSSIGAAALTPSIQTDLASKVSRERMGIECHKMLQTYRSSYFSFQLLCQEWKLRRIIFEVPQTFEPAPKTEIGEFQLQPIEKRGEVSEHENQLTQLCLNGMKLAHERIQSTPHSFTPDEASTLLLAAFLIPYYGYRTELKKGRFNTLVWYIVRESLRLTQRDAQLTSDLLIQAHQLIHLSFLHRSIHSTTTATSSTQSTSSSISVSERLQLATGHLLRQTGVHTHLAMELAQIILRVSPTIIQPDQSATFDATLGLSVEESKSTSNVDTLGQLQRYCDWIRTESRLLDMYVWDMKPIATGTEVCQELGISAKGPHVGVVLQKLMDWQLLHLDQLKPFYTITPNASNTTTDSSASASAVSSTTAVTPTAAAASTHGVPPSSLHLTTDVASLAPLKKICFEWLKANGASEAKK